MANDIKSFNTEADLIYIYSYTLDKVLVFPAFITDISDSRTTNWTTSEIYGRMDPIYTYKNTVRKVTISFDVVANSADEAFQYHEMLRDDMRKSIYPVYRERTFESVKLTESVDKKTNKKTTKRTISEKVEEGRYVLTSPPLHRIRYCNLIRSERSYVEETNDGQSSIVDGLLGWIDGYTFSPKLENGLFVDYFETEGSVYAKTYTVNLTLNVIHEHPLGFEEKEGKIQKRTFEGRVEKLKSTKEEQSSNPSSASQMGDFPLSTIPGIA